MAFSTGTLAQGAFGKVYKQKYNDTWAAIKKVPQHLINGKDLERECEVYKKAKHPNIVKLLGNINLKDGKWIIPLEFIFGEDLETTIFKAAKSKIQLSPSIKGTIILGMCEGLLHLHSRDIVHQDLKPDNIMVEHGTNRAVIIDLGLAKFFKFGLNSAMDGGNPAYSAPEVLRRGTQRDQRSDVWAMGKIIAELCARIRLHTPSVCPAKIKEVMGDQPYYNAVCRMVDPNPSLRASVGGVMHEIRKAAGASVATNTEVQKDQLKPPQVDVKIPSPADQGAPQEKRDLSPMNRGALPFNRDPSPMNRGLPPFNRDPSPMNRGLPPINKDPSPMNRGLPPFNRDPSPMNRGLPPFNRDPSPMNRGLPPFNRDPSPMNRGLPPFNRDPLPMNRGLPPFNRDPSPMNRGLPPFNRDPSPMNRGLPPFNRDQSPMNRGLPPFNRDPLPMNRGLPQFKRDLLPMNPGRPLFNRDPSPMNPGRPPFNRDPIPHTNPKWEPNPPRRRW
ncbi:serine/threonine-protein kinase DCLK1-like [Pungitius pungitius]|uniref:serine/threonine-protein kinase DCLK1-like n=1 Tax=Pungitius pungitius TaxID=134920 RepID=UPI001888B8B5|nr:serine/threonine-protein kinase DCLK1-like [Pungitius pungitius]